MSGRDWIRPAWEAFRDQCCGDMDEDTIPAARGAFYAGFSAGVGIGPAIGMVAEDPDATRAHLAEMRAEILRAIGEFTRP